MYVALLGQGVAKCLPAFVFYAFLLVSIVALPTRLACGMKVARRKSANAV